MPHRLSFNPSRPLQFLRTNQQGIDHAQFDRIFRIDELSVAGCSEYADTRNLGADFRCVR